MLSDVVQSVTRSIVSGVVLGESAGTPAVPHELASINADGWSATHSGTPPTYTPDTAPIVATPDRDGFDATGSATTISENIVLTTRVRQPHPNETLPTADQVALSDYIYSTDTISGVTNNSIVTSPKPVAQWGLLDHETIGDTLRAEVVPFHRNARNKEQVAAVIFRATDGTTTVSQTVSTSTVSTEATDQNAVVVYACSLDVSTLDNDAAITLNAEVYPHIGGAASVLDSSDQTARRDFSPRTYFRQTGDVPVAYVDTVSGNNTTGVVSTTDATAAASPFATISGAIGTTGGLRGFGDANGAIIYLEEGTHALEAAFGADMVMDSGALTITPASGATKAATIVQFGGSAFRPRINAGGGWVRFKGLTVDRTGTNGIRGESDSPLELAFVDCDVDAGSQNATFGGTNAVVQFHGVPFTNLASSSLSAGTSAVETLRGCSGTPVSNMEHRFMAGCAWTGGDAPLDMGIRSESGTIAAFNSFRDWTGRVFEIAKAADVDGAVFTQNEIEYTSATGNPVIAIGADDQHGSTTHVILHHNTVVGFDLNGRNNSFYDQGGTARTHELMSDRGNIYTQVNVKGDAFDNDATRTGHFAYHHGVGCQGNYTLYKAAGGDDFDFEYPGLGSNIGTSNTVMNGGPASSIFTSFQATTSGPTAGAGGGDYTLVVASGPIGIAQAVIRFDASGTERAATCPAGSYPVVS